MVALGVRQDNGSSQMSAKGRKTDLVGKRGENLVENAFAEILGWIARKDAPDGSGASGDFGREKGRWRTEDRQAAKHKCLISGRFPSLTRVTGHVSAPDEGLLSADAPEPSAVGYTK
jgi:hypothetical protein